MLCKLKYVHYDTFTFVLFVSSLIDITYSGKGYSKQLMLTWLMSRKQIYIFQVSMRYIITILYELQTDTMDDYIARVDTADAYETRSADDAPIFHVVPRMK